MTLEPDGTAAACKAAFEWVRLPPASLVARTRGYSSKVSMSSGQRRTNPPIGVGQSACRTWILTMAMSARLAQWKEHQTANLAVTGSTPVPNRRETCPLGAVTLHHVSLRKAGARMIGLQPVCLSCLCANRSRLAGCGIKRGNEERPLTAAPTSAL
jgi:hypothetical protein